MREGSLEAPVRHPLAWNDPDFYDETKLDAEMRRAIVDLDAYACAYPELTLTGGAASLVRLTWSEALLETIHPEILPRLNKQMTLDDFAAACARLRRRSPRSPKRSALTRWPRS